MLHFTEPDPNKVHILLNTSNVDQVEVLEISLIVST